MAQRGRNSNGFRSKAAMRDQQGGAATHIGLTDKAIEFPIAGSAQRARRDMAGFSAPLTPSAAGDPLVRFRHGLSFSPVR
jgi:hypothetical protein